jgi:hypothetical protein
LVLATLGRVAAAQHHLWSAVRVSGCSNAPSLIVTCGASHCGVVTGRGAARQP